MIIRRTVDYWDVEISAIKGGLDAFLDRVTDIPDSAVITRAEIEWTEESTLGEGTERHPWLKLTFEREHRGPKPTKEDV